MLLSELLNAKAVSADLSATTKRDAVAELVELLEVRPRPEESGRDPRSGAPAGSHDVDRDRQRRGDSPR